MAIPKNSGSEARLAADVLTAGHYDVAYTIVHPLEPAKRAIDTGRAASSADSKSAYNWLKLLLEDSKVT